MSPSISFVGGPAVARIISGARPTIRGIVEQAYRLHAAGHTILPHSAFLRFSNTSRNRIIALPACIRSSAHEAVGIKWVASFPDNVSRGLNRASALIVLNDPSSGYPYAVLEGSTISAARTAASAALAADWLNNRIRRTDVLGIVGCGVISKAVIDFLCADGWDIETLQLFDSDRGRAELFLQSLGTHFGDVRIMDTGQQVVRASTMLLLATTATEPWLAQSADIRHNPIILHLSLRDLSPALITAARNVVDDIDHCLQANTSLHLAEQATASRRFISGTLVEVMDGVCRIDRERPLIFSPFGLGVLDLAVAHFVFNEAGAAHLAIAIPEFFSAETGDSP
jgi:2,3-diaminopropionate biosynthesis protein SbnB